MSPKLLQQTAKGELVRQVKIDLAPLKGVRPVAVTFVLTDVQITADAVSDGGENVEMVFVGRKHYPRG